MNTLLFELLPEPVHALTIQDFGTLLGRGIGTFPAVDVTPTRGIHFDPAERRDMRKGTMRYSVGSWLVVADYRGFCAVVFSEIS